MAGGWIHQNQDHLDFKPSDFDNKTYGVLSAKVHNAFPFNDSRWRIHTQRAVDSSKRFYSHIALHLPTNALWRQLMVRRCYGFMDGFAQPDLVGLNFSLRYPLLECRYWRILLGNFPRN